MSTLSHSRFRLFRVAVCLALIVTLVPIAGAAGPPDDPGGISPKAPYSRAAAEGPAGLKGPVRTPAPQRVAVEWRTGVPQSQIEAAASQIGFRVVRRSEKLGWTLVEPTKRGVSAARLAEDLKSARLATRATPERLYQPQATIPNDPRFDSLWGLDNTGQTGGTPDADIDAPEAWGEYGTGSSDVVVAVIDTGVNHAHPDLRPNRWVNAGEIPNNGIDDDGNGWIDDYFGYDFYNYDSTPYDPADGDQHGTHVAGTIGAKGDNGIGVAGVNWDVTIMPVKFLGPFGGWDVDGAEAIVYAVDNGADVINASWGGGWSDILEEAINYAADHGVLFVAAAGNWGEDVDAMPEWNYPASSQAPNVVTVAATDHNDELTWWSNYGAETVEVAAPGENIVSTLPYETCALYINSPPYRISYLAMAPEAVEPASAGHALISTAVAQVGASLGTPILVVDDSSPGLTGETPDERLDVYLEALDGAGYTNVSTWSTEDAGTPPASALRNRVVVWFTGGTTWGWFMEPSLNAAERLVLGTYLDNGGRLVMASGELATDMVYFGEDWEWFEKYFQATWVDYSAWGYDFAGVAGTPFAGISGTFRDEYQVWDTYPWPTGADLVLPMTAAAKPMVRIGGYGELSGTSMAAPHVTGSLAKLMQNYPDESPDEIMARLLNTTDPADSLESTTLYGGRINLYSAHGSYPGKPKVTAPKSGEILYAGTDYDITWTPAEGGDPDATFEVEWAKPCEVAKFDFEDADLSAFEMTSDRYWEITDAPGDAYSGDRAVRSAPIADDAWGYSSMATTLTAPPGGGAVSFWGKIESPQWECWATVRLNGMEVWYGDTALPWTHFFFPLRTGENRIEWSFDTYQAPGGDNRFVVDDLTVLGWDYEPVGTAGAGETSLAWTVPATDTDTARVRVRAVLGPVYSAWDTVRNVRITTDTEAPGPPTDFEATAGTDGDAHLTWTDPTDADFELTRIVRSTEGPPAGPNDEAAEVVYEGTDGMFHNYGLTDGETYYYAAFSRDEMYNWSDGAWDSVVALDETPPEAPGMLDAFMWEGTVAMTWVPPAPETYAGVRVLRRTDQAPTGPDDPLATEVFDGPGAWAADWMLTEEPVETMAYYGAWSYDASGNWSDGAFADLWVDTIGPEGTFVLNNDDEHTPTPDVIGYADVTGAIEMRLAVNGEIEEGAEWVPYAAETEITLADVDGWQSVTAEFRDDVGNILEITDWIHVNLAPPGAPTGLTATAWGYDALLTWDDPRGGGGEESWEMGGLAFEDWWEPWPTGDFDVVGWNVFAGDDEGGPYDKITDEPVPDPEYLVTGLEVGHTYWFRVQAVDAVGLESVLSEPVSFTPGEALYAFDDEYTVSQGKTLTVAAPGVLGNDIAAPGTDLVAQLAEDVSVGSLTLNEDGSFTYTPPASFTGTATFLYQASDGVDLSNVAMVSISVTPTTVTRLADRTRFSTAVAIARAGYPGWAGVKHVIIASGDDRAAADPLAASGLCWAYDAPMLLVSAARTPDEVKTALKQVTDVNGQITLHVVGGPVSVPDARLAELVAAGGGAGKVKLDRLLSTGGRYDLAAAIAARMKSVRGAEMPSAALIANGADATKFFDALALSPISAGTGAPILLVTADSIPAATANALNSLKPGAIIVGGGPNTVSERVRSALRATRWSGRTRYDTAIAIADGAVGKGWLAREDVGIAAKLPDALTGGSLIGAKGGVLLLTDGATLTPATQSWLSVNKKQISAVWVFGGPLSISNTVVTQIRNAIK